MFEELLEAYERHKKAILIGIMSLVVTSVAYLGLMMFQSNASKVSDQSSVALSSVVQSKDKVRNPDSKQTTVKEETSVKVVVDIKGAVAKAGVYELAPDARVSDVIAMAGGITENADPKSVNYAQKVEDEMVIYVATKDEGISIVESNTTASKSGEPDGKINLNKATKEELTTISGIGDKKAEDIIAYREAHGGFQSVDELANVSGIGEKTVGRLAEEVTVD